MATTQNVVASDQATFSSIVMHVIVWNWPQTWCINAVRYFVCLLFLPSISPFIVTITSVVRWRMLCVCGLRQSKWVCPARNASFDSALSYQKNRNDAWFRYECISGFLNEKMKKTTTTTDPKYFSRFFFPSASSAQNQWIEWKKHRTHSISYVFIRMPTHTHMRRIYCSMPWNAIVCCTVFISASFVIVLFTLTIHMKWVNWGRKREEPRMRYTCKWSHSHRWPNFSEGTTTSSLSSLSFSVHCNNETKITWNVWTIQTEIINLPHKRLGTHEPIILL